jgi:hypothetical protein
MTLDGVLGLPPGHLHQSFSDYLRAHRPDLLPLQHADGAVPIAFRGRFPIRNRLYGD